MLSFIRTHKTAFIIAAAALVISSIAIYARITSFNRAIDNLSPEDLMPHDAEKILSDDADDGIAGKAVLADGRERTFLTDHTIPELNGAAWEWKGKALVYYSGEGSSYLTIIDGYEYEGYYDQKDGMCYYEVSDPGCQCLDDEGYYPIPSKGRRLKSFKWFTDKAEDENRKQIHKLKITAFNGTVTPLAPQAGNTYEASNLVDGDISTAWAIDLDKTDCTGGVIWGPIFNLPKNAVIDHITIYNGYCKNEKTFRDNTRAAWIQIYRPIPPDTGDPEPPEILFEGPLKDSPGPQKLPVNRSFDFSEPIDALVLKIMPVWKGHRYFGDKYRDLCISEIEFYGQ